MVRYSWTEDTMEETPYGLYIKYNDELASKYEFIEWMQKKHPDKLKELWMECFNIALGESR